MLQGFLGKVLGSNQPLWSLSFEWWIYFLFPLLLSRRTAIIALAGLAAAAYLGPDFAPLFLVWALGAAFRVVETRVSLPTFLAVLAVVGCLFLDKFAETKHYSGLLDVADVMLGLAVALSIPVLGANFPLRAKELWRDLAAFSYSLYLTHFPLMVLFFVIVAPAFGHPHLGRFAMVDPRGWLIFGLGMVVFVASAYFVAALLERPLSGWKKRLHLVREASA